MLCVSGTAPSLAMLQLMATGYDAASHKKITADPKVVVLDDSCLFDHAQSNVPEVLRVVSRVPDMPRQVITVPFELVFLDSFQETCGKFYEEHRNLAVVDLKEMDVSFEGLAQTARTTFENIKTVSAREDIHRSLHLKLLSNLARTLNSTKVMLPDTSTDLAARLLSAVARGRGSHVPNETQYLDKRLPDVTIINCMREFTPKECTYYLHRLGITPVTMVTHTTLSDPIVGSINRLTDTFISGLQENFPSTVNTVMKTAAKLQSLPANDRNCELCLLPIVTVDNLEERLSGLMFGADLCAGCKVSLSESEESVAGLVCRSEKQKVLEEFLIEQ